VKKTRRVIIVHEDGHTAGFGAEVAATIAQEAFFSLDAPVKRVAVPDIPIPYNLALMDAVLPSFDTIADAMAEVLET
jgi:2-oxoisovalerate dehydrogenase E1 component